MSKATERHADPAHSAGAAPVSPWGALHYGVFRWLWLATVVNNIGGWMYNAASGWLMTSLNPDPFIVSLVQVANSLPLFIFALPAGALADMIDKRRFILVLEILTTVFCTAFALLVAWNQVTPVVLLVFIALIGTLGAIETPAWQAITPLLVHCGPGHAGVAEAGTGLWYNIRSPARVGLPAPITTLLSGLAGRSLSASGASAHEGS